MSVLVEAVEMDLVVYLVENVMKDDSAVCYVGKKRHNDIVEYLKENG